MIKLTTHVSKASDLGSFFLFFCFFSARQDDADGLRPGEGLPRDAVALREEDHAPEHHGLVPGGSVDGERANFTELDFGGIEAKFCK